MDYPDFYPLNPLIRCYIAPDDCFLHLLSPYIYLVKMAEKKARD